MEEGGDGSSRGGIGGALTWSLSTLCAPNSFIKRWTASLISLLEALIMITSQTQEGEKRVEEKD